MGQLSKLSLQIQAFSSENDSELQFLFNSLLVSLKTASKHAGASTILRATPSLKHAQNLARFLEKALLKLPVPSLHNHICDLFDYVQRSLEENLRVPVEDELLELLQLTQELRKGISSLLNEDSSRTALQNEAASKRNSLNNR
jgi:flagellin-specific chaperone FliS